MCSWHWRHQRCANRALLGTFLREAKLKIQNSLLGKGAQAHNCGRPLGQGPGIMVDIAGASMHAHLGLLVGQLGGARHGRGTSSFGGRGQCAFCWSGRPCGPGQCAPYRSAGQMQCKESGGWLHGGAKSQLCARGVQLLGAPLLLGRWEVQGLRSGRRRRGRTTGRALGGTRACG